MAELATYLYLSRVGKYEGFPDPTTPDTVYAYTVYSNGFISSMGLGVYSAAWDYYYPGAAYGYEPPQYLRDDPYWETFDPSAAWYGFTGSVGDYWDLRYGVTDPSIIRRKPMYDTERPYFSSNASGEDLLSSTYLDTSAISTTGIDAEHLYLYIAPWYPPGDEPPVTQVLGVVDLTALYALHGLGANPAHHTADFFVDNPAEEPKFWTNLVGTKETV